MSPVKDIVGHEKRLFCGRPGGGSGEKLTLVVDETVGSQQLEGVDLEQNPVEQQVVSRRTEFGFVAQARLGELLQEEASSGNVLMFEHYDPLCKVLI